MKKPIFEETAEVDYIKCCWCGERFGGESATNYDTSCNHVVCPFCERGLSIFQSIEYTAHPTEE